MLCIKSCSVYSLPIRNGNEELLKLKKMEKKVYSLPIRNGNNKIESDTLNIAPMFTAYL